MKNGRQLVAEYGFAQFYAIAISVVTLPLTARWLGPEGRGIMAAAIAWGALLGGLASISLGHALQYRLQSRASADLGTHLGTLGLSAVVLGAGGAALVLGLMHLPGASVFGQLPNQAIWLLALFMPLFVWDQYLTPLSGLAHTLSPLSRWQVAVRTAVAAGLFALAGLALLTPLSVLGTLWTGHLLIGAAAALFIWRSAKRARVDMGELRALLPTALKLHIATAGALLLETGTVLLINDHLSKKDVGLYQLAQQMIALLLIGPQTLAVVLTSRISLSSPEGYWPRHREILLKATAAMLAIAVAAYVLAPVLVRVLAGPQFEESAHIFRVLLPSLVGLTLSQLLVPQWISRGILWLHALVTVSAAVLMLAGTSWAIGEWGIEGAAYVRTAVFGGFVVVSQLCFLFWVERRGRRASPGFTPPS